jgi:hypothetical protein
MQAVCMSPWLRYRRLSRSCVHRTFNRRWHAPVLFIRTYGWGDRTAEANCDRTFGPKYPGLQQTRPLIDDEPLTAVTRAAMAGDVTAQIATAAFAHRPTDRAHNRFPTQAMTSP